MKILFEDIIQGSIRSILSSRNLEDILQVRSELGDDFTESVKEQLKNWGIEPVKNIELMDIRDSKVSQVIANIMNKKISEIEKESRIKVANNKKEAQMAEIEAQQATEVKQQEANKTIGLKTVENEREVAISREQANQAIKEQEKTTREKTMEVLRVEKVKQAEINKDAEIVKAEEEKKKIELDAEARKAATIRSAEADKERQFLEASALLEMKDKESQGILKIGTAEAESLKLKELAPVTAQITLAKEIGENEGYQQYLVTIRQVEANEKIGIEQAKALASADMKIIANGGDVQNGISKVGEILSSKGGMSMGAMLEGLAQIDIGKDLLKKFTTIKGQGDNSNKGA
ncbi:SPFH domain-containing protein [Helicobacter cinaedi]|uniref:SPFH domain-containing protein n=1 Tax=Helicobacter cinaedi TaxID=213 RepID=UPI001E32D008|nr:SPFH domain-containing protein [Helicobacter cinaedi]